LAPPPLSLDPDVQYHWLRPGADGNVDYMIQDGDGPAVLAFWHGRKDQSHHVAAIGSEVADSVNVTLDDIYDAWRVRVEYDGRGPV
jgi:hypothetical protein